MLTTDNTFDLDSITNKYQIRMRQANLYFARCSVINCINTDIEIHHIRKLNRKVEKDGKISILTREGKKKKGLGAFMSAINRKQLPLCSLHHRDFENNKYHELDLNYLKDNFNIGIPKEYDINELVREGESEINSGSISSHERSKM